MPASSPAQIWWNARRATAWRGYTIDGTDPQACIDTVHEAVARARAGDGPQMVVADLLRLVGHGEHDDATTSSHALKVSPIGRDCLDVAREQLIGHGWATAAQLDALRDQAIGRGRTGLRHCPARAAP